MAQTKKDNIRDRILTSARDRLLKHGYAATTMRSIAAEAGISTSNLYVYFPSKLALLFAIYDPWLRNRLDELEETCAAMDDPRARLRVIITTLWETIPAEDGGFGNTFVEGLAVSGREGGYSRELLLWAEDKISALIASCLDAERTNAFGDTALAHILFMAFDGFAVNYTLIGRSRRLDRCIDVMVEIIAGPETGQPE